MGELLEDLFKRYTVLFIGYGLEEDDILERIVKFNKARKTLKHCWLYPRYSYNQGLISHLTRYYLELANIELTDYSLDALGYEQLRTVIQDWAPKLKKEWKPPGSSAQWQTIMQRAIDEQK